MRILFATLGYKPAYRLGGTVVCAVCTAENLVRRGHEVTVFTTDSNHTENLDVPVNQAVDVDGVKVWYFSRRDYIKKMLPFVPYLAKSVGFMFAPKMRAELERIMPEIDIVHTQNPFIYPTYASATAAFRHGKPVIYHQHGALGIHHLKHRAIKKRLYIAAFERKILRGATTLIASTEAEISSYQALGVDTPCSVVANGINLESFEARRDGSIDKLFDMNSDDTVILFLGRLHPIKGADSLLDGFARIHHKFPNARLVMAGPDEYGLEAEFREHASQAGLDGKVIWAGMVSEEVKLKLLARADLYCLPSHAEGFSMAVLEALASSTAVLLSPGCNFPQVELAGAGRVVSEAPESLATALSEMLANPGDLRKMGRAARELVAREYTWDKITDQIVDVYEEAIRRNAALHL